MADDTSKHTGVERAIDKTQDAVGAAVGKAAASTAGSHSAQSFVNNAALGDVFEIEASQLALERSRSGEIRSVAEQMIKDHTEASQKLKSVLAGMASDEIDAPSEDLDPRRQGMLDNLKAAPDDKFDDTYLDQQLAAHEEATTLFNGYRDNGDKPQLTSFAGEIAPILERHLEHVKQARSALGK